MATIWTGAANAPTPGSVWGIAAGCLCAPNVNNGGRGLSGFKDGNGRPVFSVHPTCPQHSITGDQGSYNGHAATAAQVPKPS